MKNKTLRTITTLNIIIRFLAVVLLILKPELVSSIILKSILVISLIYIDIFTCANLKGNVMRNMKNSLIYAYTVPVICADNVLTYFVLFKSELVLPTSLNIVWIISLIYIAIFAYANLTKSKKVTKRNKIRKINVEDYDSNKIIIFK